MSIKIFASITFLKQKILCAFSTSKKGTDKQDNVLESDKKNYIYIQELVYNETHIDDHDKQIL
jgi:hypothetical protein